MPLEKPGQADVFYWRTWYLDTCEQHSLFGLTEDQAKYAETHHFAIAAHVYLVDMSDDHPGSTRHSVSGPFEVMVTTSLPRGAEVVLGSSARVVLYKDPHPEHGPWRGEFAEANDFFPFRFSIRRASQHTVDTVSCEASPNRRCFYCGRL